MSTNVAQSLDSDTTAALHHLLEAAERGIHDAIAETIVSRITDQGFDASLIRLGAYVVGFLAAVVIIVTGVQQLGADVVPLLAGLGVGGLAVALAVRPTLENMIGGVILFADKPIKVGDYCTFGGQSGTVERIGLRSTRIRADSHQTAGWKKSADSRRDCSRFTM